MVKQRKVVVVAQGHLLQMRVPGLQLSPDVGGLRGDVTAFSAASRKRMLELLARIDVDSAGFVAFATITYPDGDGPPEPEVTERDRQTLIKRIRRRHPESSGIWRREHEARKSGAFEGVSFPHYHFLFFGLPFLPHEDLKALWAEVIAHDGYVRTEIKGIKSWRQAFAYVAKYMAKTEAAVAGVTSPPGTDGGDAACSLVYGAYLTADEEQTEPRIEVPAGSIGRSWGVFNRKGLPLAERHLLELPRGEWLPKAKDRAREHWPGVSELAGVGFTLFTEDPEEWLRRFAALHELLEYGVLSDEFGPELLN